MSVVAALLCAPAALAYETGDVVSLTSTVQGRVLYATGGSNRVEAFANPDNKPTGFLEINNTYFINGDSFIVDRIAEQGFSQCDKLTKVQLGIDCWSLGRQAFYGCTKLTAITEYESGSIESIGESAFSYCYALESVNLPGVTSIGNWAFVKTPITTASFPAVKTIGVGAFQECDKLASFVGGEALESIGNIAFINCPSLTGITLGPDLISIGTTAFGFDTALKSVVVPCSVELIDRDAYQGIGAETVYILSPKFMDYCDKSKLLRNKSISQIFALPDLVAEINYYLSVGSDDNPAESLTSARAVSLSNLVELSNVPDTDKFSVIYKRSGITDFHIYDISTGTEIPESNGYYEIGTSSVRLSYRIGIDLLDYNWSLTRQHSGVSQIDTDLSQSGTVTEYYTVDGLRVENPVSGIYIVRTPDGIVSKVKK